MARADRWKRVEMESLVVVARARPLAHQSCFALITFSKKQNPGLADPGTNHSRSPGPGKGVGSCPGLLINIFFNPSVSGAATRVEPPTALPI